MSFTSLLGQIKRKTPPTPNSTITQEKKQQITVTNQPVSRHKPAPDGLHKVSKGPIKIDPAVQRLKELRRQENESKEALQRKSQAAKRANAPPRSRTTVHSSQNRVSKSSMGNTVTHAKSRPTQANPIKRLSFAELMKQGQQKTKALGEKETSPPINTSTLSSKTQGYQSKTRPVSTATNPKPTSKPTSYNTLRPSSISNTKPSSSHPVNKSRFIMRPKEAPKPKPLAQPSAKLKAKLEERKRTGKSKRQSISRPGGGHYDDDEYDSYDDDGFIVDDEEEEIDDIDNGDSGYDRDEIWKMFNKGKSRYDYNDYNDDLSDMEADGDEILEEEEMSSKRARIEEKREAEMERRRVEEKRRRLGNR